MGGWFSGVIIWRTAPDAPSFFFFHSPDPSTGKFQHKSSRIPLWSSSSNLNSNFGVAPLIVKWGFRRPRDRHGNTTDVYLFILFLFIIRFSFLFISRNFLFSFFIHLLFAFSKRFIYLYFPLTISNLCFIKKKKQFLWYIRYSYCNFVYKTIFVKFTTSLVYLII